MQSVIAPLLVEVANLPAMKVRAAKELARLEIANLRDLVLHVPNALRNPATYLAARRKKQPPRRMLYPSTKKLSSKALREMIGGHLEALPSLPEWIDSNFFATKQWPHWKEAVQIVHQPIGPETEAAYLRLAFDELLANQLALLISRRRFQAHEHYVLNGDSKLRAKFLKALPFEMTESQAQVCREIDMDLASGQRMLRLVQGDVGSGKTAVAVNAILMALECGKQAALMAPTEIVARQHHEWITTTLKSLKLPVELLTGSDKPHTRETILARIKSGETGIVIGTHALFQEGVEFANLALVVVDEQHRFGVNQRLQLAAKGQDEQGARPHMLLMTATPIPRTMTLTAFGDTDVSRLTDKPPGRKPIQTQRLPQSDQDNLLAKLEQDMKKGERIYWICPTIDDSEKSELVAAQTRYEQFSARFPDVGLVHGRMDGESRQQILNDFVEGKLRMLISTTVVEVGVNVPEATIIVIEHAERFGLAQLHQLRGRVGRGEKQSHCYLLHADGASDAALARLRAVCETEDGFAIAEEDWKIRGAGDWMGTKQSGTPKLRFADLQDHYELALAARDNAKVVLGKDPHLTSEQGEVFRALLCLFGYEDKVALLDDGLRLGASAA